MADNKNSKRTIIQSPEPNTLPKLADADGEIEFFRSGIVYGGGCYGVTKFGRIFIEGQPDADFSDEDKRTRIWLFDEFDIELQSNESTQHLSVHRI